MGNALDFLHKKETYTRTKSKHNALCKEKIGKHTKEHGVTKCEDSLDVKIGCSGNLRVNERFSYTNNLLEINAREAAKREPIPCVACGEMFTPTKIRRAPTVHEKELGIDKFQIWCGTCRRKGTAYREKMVKFGGLKHYTFLMSKVLMIKTVVQLTSLRDLFRQIEIREELGMPTARVNETIEKIIKKAWKENAYRDVSNSHYKFDF